VVNPDADSVTPLDTSTLTAGMPVAVGREPWAVALTAGGMVVVMNRADGSLSLLADGVRTDVPIGAEPGGLALSADGRTAFVTLSAAAEVVAVDLVSRTVSRRHSVGPQPWMIGVAGERVVVTHRFPRKVAGGFEASDGGKEAWLTVLQDGAASEIVLPAQAFGFPNVIEGLTIRGDDVYLVHLLNSPEVPNDFQTSVSSALSFVSLDGPGEIPERGQHLNDAAFSIPVNYPRAVTRSAGGNELFIVLAGSDLVMGVDVSNPEAPRLLGYWPVGTNPRGIVLNGSGTRAFVMNYLSRDVSVLDVADFSRRVELARVPVVGETLDLRLLRGKILFNTAADPRLTMSGWMSCASCHPDGGPDGTTWQLGEGPRQTMPLWNLAGTAPFHAAATRDEVQDFEHDIEQLLGGVGLSPGVANPLLGTPNAGHPDLDALAEFVLHGIRTPRSAYADTAAAARGRRVFEMQGCHACHAGPAWTTSHLPGAVGSFSPDGEQVVTAVLHDVGTFDAQSDITGEAGFDVPTLLGLHATAPYLHSGAARDLTELLTLHAPDLSSPAESADLVAFLLSIDDTTAVLGGGTLPVNSPAVP
jgi:DNA-binding beta-propeller fold protein YncE